MSEFEFDPVVIRVRLEALRELGTPWDRAWPEAIGRKAENSQERELLAFMEKHFRAAYHDSPSRMGRCRVPERDVSHALMLARRPVDISSDSERCRSGDGCDREAVRGRFRKMWCEHHGAELAEIGKRLRLDMSKADPRNNGNKSLFTHRAAA